MPTTVLTATSELEFGECRVASALMLSARVRAHLVWRHQLLFDTRFNAPHGGMQDRVTLYLVHAGAVAIGDATYAGPVAVLAEPREYERYEAGAPFVRSWGDPCLALDVLLRREDVRAPVGLARGPVPVSPAAWAAIEALAERLVAGDALPAALHAVLRELAACGVVAPEVAGDGAPPEPIPDSVVRIWEAMAPFHARWDATIDLIDLAEAAMRSSRQLSRDAKQLCEWFGLSDPRFRDVTAVYRLRLAALLLSARWATVGEVATKVGYGSIDALGRAFRDAGLPPPSEVRALVLAPV